MTSEVWAPVLNCDELATRLQQVVSLGNRFAGSAGEERAATYLLEQFEQAGLARVRAEEFRYLGYQPVSCLCMCPDENLDFPCSPLEYTADATADAEAVYVGAGRPEDLELVERRGVQLAGKVVVAQSYFTFQVAPLLAERHVAALVNVGETPDGLVGAFTAALYPPPVEAPWEGRPLPFPGVTIEAQAGRDLLALLGSGAVRLRVEHRARYAEALSANVIGELVGEEEPERQVVLGAHYDTQLEGPGAADNATGLAVLVELAKAWRQGPRRRTVVFSAWGVEELGIWGSHDYVLRRCNEVDDIVAMVNLDALGLPFPGRRVVVADPALTELAETAASSTGWTSEGRLDASTLPFADYAPFIDAGIPAAWFWVYPPQHPYYHSAGDILRYVDIDQTHGVAEATAALIDQLSNRVELNVGRAKPARRWSQPIADAVACSHSTTSAS